MSKSLRESRFLLSRYYGRNVTLLSPNGCSLEFCIPLLLLLRTNNMYVTVIRCTNHFSRYICPQRSRFPRQACSLLVNLRKVKNDHRSNFPISAIGRKKYEDFNGIRTRGLCETGAMLNQLSCEATHCERGQFVKFLSSRAVK